MSAASDGEAVEVMATSVTGTFSTDSEPEGTAAAWGENGIV
jgi:hypothetical protein